MTDQVRQRTRPTPVTAAQPQRQAERKPERRQEPDYEVGYGKPPIHSRFQPGQSGNLRGRPKKARTTAAFVLQEAEAEVTIQVNGKSIVVGARQALLKRVFAEAMQGKAWAMKLYFTMLLQAEMGVEPDVATDLALSRADQELLQAFLEADTDD